MSSDAARYRKFADVRVSQLHDEERQLRHWLIGARLLGWPILLLSIVSPIAAGAVALWAQLGPEYRLVVPLLSFLGAAAIAVHRGLNCEAYQTALKRTAQIVRSILEDFEGVEPLPDDKVASAYERADARLRELRATSNDLPPKRMKRFEPLAASA